MSRHCWQEVFFRLLCLIGFLCIDSIFYFSLYNFSLLICFESIKIDKHDFFQQLVLVKRLIFFNQHRKHFDRVDLLPVMLQKGKNVVKPVVEQ